MQGDTYGYVHEMLVSCNYAYIKKYKNWPLQAKKKGGGFSCSVLHGNVLYFF
jgi:hypothetical protein